MTTQGSRLKKLRRALNLSQEEFGGRLAVSKQYISNLEADRNLLNNEKIAALFFDFNVNLNWLIGGTGAMFNINNSPSVQIDDDFKAKVKFVLKSEGLIN